MKEQCEVVKIACANCTKAYFCENVLAYVPSGGVIYLHFSFDIMEPLQSWTFTPLWRYWL